MYHRLSFSNHGNDTIDPYPLTPAEATKILCITDSVFQTIKQQYQAFCQRLKTRPKTKSFNIGQINQNSLRQNRSKRPREHFSTYEPSKALAVNECDYRRWCRVAEWFNQYGADAKY